MKHAKITDRKSRLRLKVGHRPVLDILEDRSLPGETILGAMTAAAWSGSALGWQHLDGTVTAVALTRPMVLVSGTSSTDGSELSPGLGTTVPAMSYTVPAAANCAGATTSLFVQPTGDGLRPDRATADPLAAADPFATAGPATPLHPGFHPGPLFHPSPADAGTTQPTGAVSTPVPMVAPGFTVDVAPAPVLPALPPSSPPGGGGADGPPAAFGGVPFMVPDCSTCHGAGLQHVLL